MNHNKNNKKLKISSKIYNLNKLKIKKCYKKIKIWLKKKVIQKYRK